MGFAHDTAIDGNGQGLQRLPIAKHTPIDRGRKIGVHYVPVFWLILEGEMDYETVILEKNEGVATLTLNRPDRLNALNTQMAIEMMDALAKIEADKEVRVLLITGSGRAFCAGGDVKRFHEIAEARKRGEPVGESLTAVMWRAPLMMQEMTKPIIAAINGPAVGFGCTLACACDIRLATEDAVLGAVFVRVGLTPEFGSTFNLPRIVGIAKALELVLTGKMVDAREAREIGLVNQVLSADKFNEAVSGMARTIAQGPPMALKLAKQGLYQGLENALATQVQWEILAINQCFQSEDHAEGVRAFLEKRNPNFRGC